VETVGVLRVTVALYTSRVFWSWTLNCLGHFNIVLGAVGFVQDPRYESWALVEITQVGR